MLDGDVTQWMGTKTGPVARGLDESCWLADAPWECEYFWDGGGSECGAEAVVLGDYLCCMCALLFFRVVVVFVHQLMGLRGVEPVPRY